MSFQNLLDADPDAFDDIAGRWARLSSQLTATAGDIKRTLGRLDGWRGEGAEAARDHFRAVRSGYETAAECIEKVPPALRRLSDGISAAQATAKDVVDTVDSTYLLWMGSETGEVHAGAGGPGDTRTDEEKEQDRATARELTRRVQKALEDVREADQVASSALAEAAPSAAGLELEAVGSGNIVAPSDIPGDDASPQEVHRWWNSLAPMEQESAIYTHGDVLGGMDGIPIDARDRANQIRFAEEHAEIGARHAELERLGDSRTVDQQREYEQLGETLRGMDSIDERLEREPSDTRPQSYLIDYSTEGRGRGVVATGNPDTADNVVTSVPGTGAGLGGIDGNLDRSERILQRADEFASRADTAAITWVGYDAPQDVGQATNAHYAEDAADDLRSFESGLAVTHENGDWNNTVIGHSYGSTVIGHAAQGDDAQLDVDNMVLIGSPGVGVDHSSELQVPEDADIYASTAQHDIIQATPTFIHGPQPISDDFGAQTFESDPGTEGSFFGYSSEAHSEYWNRDSTSLKNMVRIVVGGEPN